MSGHQNFILRPLFGARWDSLPEVMFKRCAVRPFSNDVVTIQGHVTVRVSPLMGWMSRRMKTLIPYSGENIPVTIQFFSGEHTDILTWRRTFHYPDHGDYVFESTMEVHKEGEVIEWIGFGLGWRAMFEWDGERIRLTHKDYVFRIGKLLLSPPVGLVIGMGDAEEVPQSNESFSMWAHTKHPIWGETLRYEGVFRVLDT